MKYIQKTLIALCISDKAPTEYEIARYNGEVIELVYRFRVCVNSYNRYINDPRPKTIDLLNANRRSLINQYQKLSGANNALNKESLLNNPDAINILDPNHTTVTLFYLVDTYMRLPQEQGVRSTISLPANEQGAREALNRHNSELLDQLRDDKTIQRITKDDNLFDELRRLYNLIPFSNHYQRLYNVKNNYLAELNRQYQLTYPFICNYNQDNNLVQRTVQAFLLLDNTIQTLSQPQFLGRALLMHRLTKAFATIIEYINRFNARRIPNIFKQCMPNKTKQQYVRLLQSIVRKLGNLNNQDNQGINRIQNAIRALHVAQRENAMNTQDDYIQKKIDDLVDYFDTDITYMLNYIRDNQITETEQNRLKECIGFVLTFIRILNNNNSIANTEESLRAFYEYCDEHHAKFFEQYV